MILILDDDCIPPDKAKNNIYHRKHVEMIYPILTGNFLS